MRKDGRIQHPKFPGPEKSFLFLFVWSLFILHFSLSTSFADEVRSRAAVVMDSSTGRILYAKNPDLKCFPASTTKLMTAIVVIENKDLRDVVTISRNAALTPPHKAGFKEGDRVTVEELLFAALVGSANDAAVALAEAAAGSEAGFVELMNRKAAAIGATDTRFINPNGLPGPGQHITASDLAKIMNYALRYQKLREIIGTRVAEISTERGKAIFLRNTNRLLWSDEELVGGKTGFTQKARHCFVCAAERANDTVLVAVLGSPSRSDLWRESEILINRGFDVKANREMPSIYLAKASDITSVETTSYRKVKRSKKSGKAAFRKMAKHKRAKMLAKKRGKANREDPSIHLAKADDITSLEKTSDRKVVKSKKSGKAVVKKATRHKRTKMLAKKKGKAKSFAKAPHKKKHKVVKRSGVDGNKV